MKLNIHFFLLNENFSPEYAEANHQGKESENNQKHEWEDELEINQVEKIDFLRNSDLTLEGYLPNEEYFSHKVENMFVIQIQQENDKNASNLAKLGVSESILDSFDFNKNSETSTLKIYIKDYEPHGNPMPGVYIASKEFPKELIF